MEFKSRTILDDYSMIEWEVNLKLHKDSKVTKTPLKLNTCSDEDYADFYPVV
jgi:hypothetical protein